jgi:hypothetical protein
MALYTLHQELPTRFIIFMYRNSQESKRKEGMGRERSTSLKQSLSGLDATRDSGME